MSQLNPGYIQVNTEQELQDTADHGIADIIDTSGYHKGDTVFTAQEYCVKAGEMLDEFRGRIAEIAAMADYTPVGRQKQITAEAERVLPKFNAFSEFLTKADERIQKLRDSMTKVPDSDADTAAMAIREWEVRNKLPTDQLEVFQIYNEAIERGDRLVFDAIRNAPSFMRLLTQEQITTGEYGWQEKRDPATAKLTHDLRHAVKTLRDYIARSRAIIRKEGGLSGFDPIAAIAAGKNPNEESGA